MAAASIRMARPWCFYRVLNVKSCILHPASCILHQKSSSLINQDFVGVDGGTYPWQEGIVGHYVDGAVEELFQ